MTVFLLAASLVSESWMRAPVCTPTWFLLQEDADRSTLVETATNGWRDLDLPIFTDIGRCARGNACVGLRAVLDKRNNLQHYARPLENPVMPETLRVADFCRPGYERESILKPETSGRPFMLCFEKARPFFLTEPSYRTDRADFAAWRKDHPGFIGFQCLCEFDSDADYYCSRVNNVPDRALRERLLKGIPVPRDQYEWAGLVREGFRRARSLHFGSDELWTYFSSCYTLAHLMAANGAKGIVYEATGQELARWQIAAAFLRGAARQFGTSYGWYVAHYSTSVKRGETKRLGGANRWWEPIKCEIGASGGPDQGISHSLFERQCAYGWLVGASFLTVEEWDHLLTGRGPDGVRCANDWGRRFNDFYTMTRRTARGVSVTPLAVLVPVSERYGPTGNLLGMRDRYNQHAFFETLLPTPGADSVHHELRARGVEGCLFNSEFGDVYDVLTPDSGQDSAAFLKALAAYPCAFLIGGYRAEDLDRAALEAYVRGGGDLYVSIDRITDGLLAADFAGRRPGDETVLRDAQGAELAYAHRVGKGRVIVSTVPSMAPPEFRSAPPTDEEKRLATAFSYPQVVQPGFPTGYKAKLDAISSGRARFPVMEGLLSHALRDRLPVKVEGDVQWGVNWVEKVGGESRWREDGYLVWLFNNKGVEKYFGEPERLDAKAAAEVTVTTRDGRVRKVTVPPGGWTTISLTQKGERK